MITLINLIILLAGGILEEDENIDTVLSSGTSGSKSPVSKSPLMGKKSPLSGSRSPLPGRKSPNLRKISPVPGRKSPGNQRDVSL